MSRPRGDVVADLGPVYVTRRGDRYRVLWVTEGRRRERTATTEADALSIAQGVIDGLTAQPLADVSTAAVVAAYLDPALHASWGPRYREQRDSLARCHIIPTIGAVPVRDLTPQHVGATIGAMADAGYATSTVRATLRLMRDVVAWGRTQGAWVTTDPTAGVTVPRHARGVRVQGRRAVVQEEIPTDRQVDAFIDAMYDCGSMYGLLTELIAASALRWGEAIALRPCDIRGDVVSVTRQVIETSHETRYDDPKTAAGVRDVLIPADLADRLLERKEEALELIFATSKGTPLRRSNVNRRQVQPAREAAGWSDGLALHSLRHWRITRWLDSGIPASLVARMAGHANAGVTTSIYVQASREYVDEVRRFSGKS